MYIPLIVIIFIGFAITLNILLRSSTKKSKNSFTQFLKEELEANNSRKKEINEEDFVKINSNMISSIKIDNTDENMRLINARDKLLKLSQRKMIKFSSPLSNKEIKLKYGIANFELIADSEENFNRFVIYAIEFAQLLIDNKKYNEAINILKTIISYNCDISKSFILLIDCYKITNNVSELKKFKESIASGQIQCSKIYKNKVLSYIE